MSLKEVEERFEEQVGNLLWRQWEALGVRGSGLGPLSFVVDPEALLLLTWGPGRNDPRLFDSALAWTLEYSDYIDFARLKSLIETYPLPIKSVCGAWANYLVAEGCKSWAPMIKDEYRSTSTKPLFSSLAPELDVNREHRFEEFGWRRGRVSIQSGAISSPEVGTLTCARLFLRKLVGVNARAEVLLGALLGHGVDTRTLADATAYSSRSIQLLLKELEDAGLFESTRERGRSGTVRPSQRGVDLRNACFGQDSLNIRWLDLVDITRQLLTIWLAFSTITERKLSGYPAESLLNDALSSSKNPSRYASPKNLEEIVSRTKTVCDEHFSTLLDE